MSRQIGFVLRRDKTGIMSIGKESHRAIVQTTKEWVDRLGFVSSKSAHKRIGHSSVRQMATSSWGERSRWAISPTRSDLSEITHVFSALIDW